MPDADFSGREIVNVRRNNGFKPVDRAGSHVKLRYEHPETGSVRVVTVPMKQSDQGTVRPGHQPNPWRIERARPSRRSRERSDREHGSRSPRNERSESRPPSTGLSDRRERRKRAASRGSPESEAIGTREDAARAAQRAGPSSRGRDARGLSFVVPFMLGDNIFQANLEDVVRRQREDRADAASASRKSPERKPRRRHQHGTTGVTDVVEKPEDRDEAGKTAS